ncbi:MAG TPA: S8 family serine peptidase [Myxococcaceae bacterium]|nr:S8 family serine peptidase [Myxococcaceae bacterium]
MHKVTSLAVGVLLLAGCSGGNSSSGTGGPEPAALTPQAVSQIESLLMEKDARTATQRKISSQLLYRRDARLPGYSGKLPEVVPLSTPDETGRMLIDLKGDVTPEVLDLVGKLGGTVVSTTGGVSARVWVGLEHLETLAAQPAIQSIRPAQGATTHRATPPRNAAKFGGSSREARVKATREALLQYALAPQATAAVAASSAVTSVGLATSQGDHAHGADRARKFFGTDGTGVRVGVLSDSDDFKEQSISTGDLPPDTVTVPGQSGRPGSGEGTAMMEIVHDVAPGAKLFFATAFTSPESFAENIRALRFVYHCDVIIDDVIYYFESPFEDDIIAQAVDDVTTDGALYFSSAGNQGNAADGTSGTWEGDFLTAGSNASLSALPSGYTLHNWGDSLVSNRIELLGGPLILHWSDPGTLANPASSNDYDVFVLDHDLRNVLVASTDIQDGTGLPFEFLGFLLSENLRVVVAKHTGAADRAIRVVLFGGELGMSTGGATYGHSTARNAIGVAAVDAAEASGGEFIPGLTTPVELYSSDGWRQVFYKKDNTRIRGGVTFGSGGGETRFKPDLSAADGVSTTLPSGSGLNPFFGTSAAAPHAGGIAALLKSAVPTATTTRVRNAMLAGSIDIAAEGIDHQSGRGVVSAMEALSQVGARPAVFLNLTSVTTTGSASGSVVPGGTGSITVQLLNEGGAEATAVTGTLSSSNPNVTITGGTSGFPALAPGASGSNVTPFTFSVGSAASCGETIAFQLSVSFTGRGTSPTVFSFKVQTGVPSTTPSLFSFTGPRAAIPDNNAAGVNVPLPVALSGAVSKVTLSIDGTACTSAIGATTVGIDHTWVGDLVGTLSSPGGTTVVLFSRPGGTGNSGNNFCQTVLDDAATDPIQSIASSGAPWTGTFKPAQPLSAFSGEPASGTWVLNVADLASIDTGGVQAVTLAVRGFTCPP